MPTPQEKLIFVEQASCLLRARSPLCGTGILPVAAGGLSVGRVGTGALPLQNPRFLENETALPKSPFFLLPST
jgi:hypothetical protein